MAEVELVVHSEAVEAGNQIAGTVILRVDDASEIRAITLTLIGKEATIFRKQSNSGKYFKEYTGRLKSYRREEVLKDFTNNPVLSSTSQYNFLFETPVELAGSFSYKGKKASASIKYTLKVTLEDLHRAPIKKAKQEVKVIQILELPEKHFIEFQTPLLTCNCLGRGFCNTTIELSKPIYEPGETCNIRLLIDNSQARVNINSLECILWITFRFLSSHMQVCYFRKCIYFYQYQTPIKYSDTLLTPKVISLEIPLNNQKIDLNSTLITFGKLIQCTYSLQLTLEFGSIILEEPDIQAPIYIRPKIPEIKPSPRNTIVLPLPNQ